MTHLVRCFGCGGSFPQCEGPSGYKYLESVPGCWRSYGEVLAREYSDEAYRKLHRLTVDAYAAQHPGQPGPKSIQSVAGHLVSLCLVLERGKSHRQAVAAIGALTKRKGHYLWLEPPTSMGPVTVADVQTALSVEEHLGRVQGWAESVWSAWTVHHRTLRLWASELTA